jgi:hypothetical protein
MRGHGQEIDRLRGLAKVFRAVRAPTLKVLADIKASALCDRAEQVQLVKFV